jgi:beta-glucanase (GH16 family)
VTPTATSGATPSWPLAWSQEWNGGAGTQPAAADWNYDLGGGGWGNAELETYTNSSSNIAEDGAGNLVITAIQTGGSAYTSARINTGNQHTFQYGKVQARIKIPDTQGSWPAFWMLGYNIGTAGWPNCGEMDIMENIGSQPYTNHGSMHGPGYSGGSALTATINTATALNAAFHTYSIQWQANQVMFFVDDIWYETHTPADIPSGDA